MNVQLNDSSTDEAHPKALYSPFSTNVTSSCSSCIPLNPPNSHNSCYSVNLLRSIAVKRLLRMCRQYFCRNKLGDASLRRFSSKVVRHRGLGGCPGNARTWFCNKASVGPPGVQMKAPPRSFPTSHSTLHLSSGAIRLTDSLPNSHSEPPSSAGPIGKHPSRTQNHCVQAD